MKFINFYKIAQFPLKSAKKLWSFIHNTIFQSSADDPWYQKVMFCVLHRDSWHQFFSTWKKTDDVVCLILSLK